MKHLTEISRPLSLAEACEAADFAGISLDDLIRNSDNNAEIAENKKSSDAEKSASEDEQERQIMKFVRIMNPVQKEFLLALLSTVVARNQGTLVFDQASTGAVIPGSDHRDLAQ